MIKKYTMKPYVYFLVGAIVGLSVTGCMTPQGQPDNTHQGPWPVEPQVRSSVARIETLGQVPPLAPQWAALGRWRHWIWY